MPRWSDCPGRSDMGVVGENETCNELGDCVGHDARGVSAGDSTCEGVVMVMPKNVFVVVHTGCSEVTVCGVFDDREKAYGVRDVIIDNPDSYGEVDIFEREINDYYLSLNQ